MLSRVFRMACAVMCLASAAGCGGVEQEDPAGVTDPVESSGDISAQGLPPGCGAFKQTCCEGYICNTNLECDPASKRCLY
jgi:hypothetical protein